MSGPKLPIGPAPDPLFFQILRETTRQSQMRPAMTPLARKVMENEHQRRLIADQKGRPKYYAKTADRNRQPQTNRRN